MRFLLILLGTTVVIGSVGGYVVMKKGITLNPSSIFSLFTNKKGQEESPGELPSPLFDGGAILGTSQEVIEKTANTVEKAITPFAKQVGVDVNTSSSQAPSSQQSGQINVNQAVEQIKANVSSIPQEVFDRARYDYCQQVVKEYEEKKR